MRRPDWLEKRRPTIMLEARDLLDGKCDVRTSARLMISQKVWTGGNIFTDRVAFYFTADGYDIDGSAVLNGEPGDRTVSIIAQDHGVKVLHDILLRHRVYDPDDGLFVDAGWPVFGPDDVAKRVLAVVDTFRHSRARLERKFDAVRAREELARRVEAKRDAMKREGGYE